MMTDDGMGQLLKRENTSRFRCFIVLCVAVVFAAATEAPAASGKKVYVILLGGQSNAEGFGYPQYLLDKGHPLADPQSDVSMYTGRGMPTVVHRLLPLQPGSGFTRIRQSSGLPQYPGITNEPVCRFGPELSLARSVRDGIGITDAELVVVKYAVAGSSLFKHWKPDGTSDSSADGLHYQNFQATVDRALSAIKTAYPHYEVEIIGMAWVQGESDALHDGGAHAADYAANLTTFIADVRATYSSNMVFVLSKLSPNQSDNPYWPTIRAAQDAVAAADPRVTATETIGADYPGADGFADGRIHYLSSSLIQIGEDLGNALLAALHLDDEPLAACRAETQGAGGDASLQPQH